MQMKQGPNFGFMAMYVYRDGSMYLWLYIHTHMCIHIHILHKHIYKMNSMHEKTRAKEKQTNKMSCSSNFNIYFYCENTLFLKFNILFIL